MSRSSSPFGQYTSSYAGSIQSNGYGTSDEASSQVSSLSRPSGRSIYIQRKEYTSSINKIMDKFQYRVEHLFTCELDGKEVQSVADCLDRLKLLEDMGRVWGQNMLLEVRESNLQLSDIETKEALESLPLSSIVALQAVMQAGVYNSLLTMCVKDGRSSSVFMFQCDEFKADFIEKDLSRALSRRQKELDSGHPKSVAGHMVPKTLVRPSPPPQARVWNPPEDPVSTWSPPDYEDEDAATPVPLMPREEDTRSFGEEPPSPQPFFTPEEDFTPIGPYTELDRNVDILNHIFTDLEIFMGQIAAAQAKSEMKNKKKKKKKKNKYKGIKGMPPVEDFVTCLHKIKCGFNLLAELNGEINNPSAPDYVHVLFSALDFVIPHCPEGLSSTVVAPLLTPACFRLLSEEATTQEDQLWQSLGDPWNIPSTKWPEDDEDIPIYTLEFLDGWQPPEVSEGRPARRKESTRSAASQVNPGSAPSQVNPGSAPSQVNPGSAPSQKPAQRSPARRPPPPRRVEADPRHMRVRYDFTARNAKELSITKGEIVTLLDVSKQWWKVRNALGDQGFVPNNILEPMEMEPEPEVEEFAGPPVLTKRSRPREVKAWLEYKGFSKITVRCLASLSGAMLLEMPRDELKKVCPDEGGRIFFQLQSVKSALALESEMR